MSKLNQLCVICEHHGYPNCDNCGVAFLRVKDEDQVLFYLWADENRATTENEALRQSNHDEALQETDQSLISVRAAHSPPNNTADDQTHSRCSTSAGETQVTHLESNEALGPKNGQFSDGCVEGERTPDSSQSPSSPETQTITTTSSNSDSTDVFFEAKHNSDFQSLLASQISSHPALPPYPKYNAGPGWDTDIWSSDDIPSPPSDVGFQTYSAASFNSDRTPPVNNQFPGAGSDCAYTFASQSPAPNATTNQQCLASVAYNTHTSDISQLAASPTVVTSTSSELLPFSYKILASPQNARSHQQPWENHNEVSWAAPYLSPNLFDGNGEEAQQTSDERKFSQRHAEARHDSSLSIRACTSCRPTAEVDKEKPVACPFYKRDPEQYSRCMHRSFKNMSALKQHLNRHADGQQGISPGGAPVVKLPRISNVRVGLNKKWYWIWERLFGKTTPPPECPYPHAEKDMEEIFLRKSRTGSRMSQHETSFNSFDIPPTSQYFASVLDTSTDPQPIDYICASTADRHVLATDKHASPFDRRMHPPHMNGQSSMPNCHGNYGVSSPIFSYNNNLGDINGTYTDNSTQDFTQDWETVEANLKEPPNYTWPI
ncbi:hypothetical protein F4779DRAFT_18974 [Xylariaceae sp. FL0662B]|nr:hypothetical protein F4779DRAFT_18974 [Xylariaceae sp. FL0662B]